MHMQSQLSQLADTTVHTSFGHTKCIKASDYQIAISSGVVLLPYDGLFVQLIRQNFDRGVVEFIWRMLVVAAPEEISMEESLNWIIEFLLFAQRNSLLNHRRLIEYELEEISRLRQQAPEVCLADVSFV